eukprot:scaffold230882_cov27-Tisochrysis_lutea.AAC.1
MNPEKLAKMAAQVRTGGKGSVRRKKKAIHKTTTTDDKRLQNTLKRLGVNNIPAIEEVHLAAFCGCRASGAIACLRSMEISMAKHQHCLSPAGEPLQGQRHGGALQQP